MQSKLDSEFQAKVEGDLTSQVNRAFDELVGTSWKLSQYSFLVNSGGAVAVLTFLGANPKALFAWGSLGCFVVGIVAVGLELRFLTKFFAALHIDALERRSKLTTDQFTLDKAVPPVDIGGHSGKVSGWFGTIAQLAFPLGLASGFIAFLKLMAT